MRSVLIQRTVLGTGCSLLAKEPRALAARWEHWKLSCSEQFWPGSRKRDGLEAIHRLHIDMNSPPELHPYGGPVWTP